MYTGLKGPQVVHAVSAPSPTAANLDMYLLNIAKAYGVQWMPEPRRQDMYVSFRFLPNILTQYLSLNPLSEILDPEASPAVDMLMLRKLCSRGMTPNAMKMRALTFR